ncbi:protein Lines homolog 1 isoform X2 [Eublepharis macularius]|nr:protein Lines homolog 1 isoform X2 [Eublepharis macularius]
MACKGLVSLVHFQLREEGSLNSSWLAFCSETLSRFPGGGQTAECLWTLTNTIREILKDASLNKGGELKKLFSPLDSILEGFYHHHLSQVSDLPKEVPASAECINNLSGFLDLLELLVASRIQTVVTFACQRMVFLNAASVLDLTTSPVPNFIKKKSVVLLKRGILGKAGEDLVMGKVPPSFLQDFHFDEDRTAFSSTVLQFVNSGWLDRLFASEKVVHFGGCQVRPELSICSGPDEVFFRALSLVLLKALEIGVQNSTSEAEAQVFLESVMCPLLSFLKNTMRSSPCAHPFKHPCMWLSKLFIEQDDDMFEATTALLRVHLHFKRFWHEAVLPSCLVDGRARDTLTHQNGCNPHCIFLFLLQSIAFDATLLLDFLISSETCFLEYLVRYLKLLIEDWHHFAQITEGLEPTACGGRSFSLKDLPCQEKNTKQSQLNSESALHDTQHCSMPLVTSSQNCTVVRQADNEAVKPHRPSSLRRPDNMSSLGVVQRLVDYESSEDSEVEEECLADRTQRPLKNPACLDVTASTDVAGQAETLERNALLPDHKDVTVLPPSQQKMSPNNPILVEEVLQKSLKCLQELQKSISRLHRRNLFPYNPAALLKLLTRVDAISRTCGSAPSYQGLGTHSF